jgi:hypothetical protein
VDQNSSYHYRTNGPIQVIAMRTLLALVFVAALAHGTALDAQQQQAGRRSDAELQALYEKHKGDFDYLVGEWEFTTESQEFGKARGRWSVAKKENDFIYDEYRVLGDSGETWYHTATLRAYNAQLDRWELVSTEQGGGLANMGVGRKVGNEMHLEQTFGATTDRPRRLRIRYYDIRPDRFSWVADRSFDDGRTWEPNALRIEARRITPTR